MPVPAATMGSSESRAMVAGMKTSAIVPVGLLTRAHEAIWLVMTELGSVAVRSASPFVRVNVSTRSANEASSTTPSVPPPPPVAVTV